MAAVRSDNEETAVADTPNENGRHEGGRPKPLQFGLKTLMGVTTAAALLFGTLRWLNVPGAASAMVLLVLVAGAAAAGGLAVVMAGSMPGEDERE